MLVPNKTACRLRAQEPWDSDDEAPKKAAKKKKAPAAGSDSDDDFMPKKPKAKAKPKKVQILES